MDYSRIFNLCSLTVDANPLISPADFVVEVGGQYYHGYTTPGLITWTAANAYCHDAGAWLAVVGSNAQLGFVGANISAGEYWIGLHVGEWTWHCGKLYVLAISNNFI